VRSPSSYFRTIAAFASNCYRTQLPCVFAQDAWQALKGFSFHSASCAASDDATGRGKRGFNQVELIARRLAKRLNALSARS
jgi:predicted amidophosphoribosyltransferase